MDFTAGVPDSGSARFSLVASQSARELAHSTTLRAEPAASKSPPDFGLPQSSTAFEVCRELSCDEKSWGRSASCRCPCVRAGRVGQRAWVLSSLTGLIASSRPKPYCLSPSGLEAAAFVFIRTHCLGQSLGVGVDAPRLEQHPTAELPSPHQMWRDYSAAKLRTLNPRT